MKKQETRRQMLGGVATAYTLLCTERSVLAQSKQTQPSPRIVRRNITQDGSVEIIYSDGTKKLRQDSADVLIKADGTKETYPQPNVEVPRITPPDLPEEEKIADWIDDHAERLLVVLKAALNNGQAYANYTKWENRRSLTTYQKVDIRLRYISRLTRV